MTKIKIHFIVYATDLFEHLLTFKTFSYENGWSLDFTKYLRIFGLVVHSNDNMTSFCNQIITTLISTKVDG